MKVHRLEYTGLLLVVVVVSVINTFSYLHKGPGQRKEE